MLYGYDAGVLGGVQTTKPFLDAIGVRELSVFGSPLIVTEPDRHLCDTYDRLRLHPRCYRVLPGGNGHWYASGPS
jgi:hypothetical protein